MRPLIHGAQIAQDVLVAVFFAEIAIDARFSVTGRAMAQMIVAAHRIAVAAQVAGKIVVPADVFAHAVRDLDYRFRLHGGVFIKVAYNGVFSIR